MTHPLEDCYDKLDRADEHLKAIEAEIQRFLKTDPYYVVPKGYPGVGGKFHVVATARIRRYPPRNLRLLIGEFFYQMRSSLDQLAYVLATPASGGDPPRGTEFPIFKDRSKFFSIAKKGTRKGKSATSSGLFKMRGMPRGPQTCIKWLQPYRRINDPEGHPLWVLHDMGIGDRHKKAHITGAILEGQSLGVINIVNAELDVSRWDMAFRRGPFKDRATIGQLTTTFIGDGDVEMYADFSYGVAFDPKGPARGEPVVTKLIEIRNFVRRDVFSKLEKFV